MILTVKCDVPFSDDFLRTFNGAVETVNEKNEIIKTKF